MSRLRRPTSASTSTTFAPVAASAAPVFAVVVVLPTPPLPLVMTIARPRRRGTALDAGASSRWIILLTRFSEEAAEEARRAQRRERNEIAFEPARDLVVDRRQTRIRLQGDRFALVGGVDHLFVLGDDAEQLRGEDVGDVFDREHVTAAHHLGPQPVHDQAHGQPALRPL